MVVSDWNTLMFGTQMPSPVWCIVMFLIVLITDVMDFLAFVADWTHGM